MPFCRTASLALLTLGAAALAPSAHAQLVANGGFEAGDFTGWTLAGNADFTSNSPNTFVFGAAHSGDYAAFFAPVATDGILSQTVATTPGQAYIVSYWLAVGSDPTGHIFTPNDFSASFGGTSLSKEINLTATDGHAEFADDYTRYSYTAVATSASSVLQFNLRDDNAYFRLDDISVNAAPVPEASATLSLGLLLAFGGGALLVRRRKSCAYTAE